LNREFRPLRLSLSGTPERSGVVAAALSFIFPGLGQAYLLRRRSAIMFAAPIAALIAVLLLFVLIEGINRVGAKLLNPTIALGAALLLLLVGIWWIANVINAWRAGRRRGTNALIAPAILVVAIAAGTLYGADWMYRLSIADRNFGTGCDPTLDCPPGPTPSGIAVVPTSPPPSGPTVPPEETPETPEPTEPPATIAPGPSPSFDITKLPAAADGWLNVLLVGIDSRCAGMGVVTGANTDTMIVASANADTGEVFMFSFPRDTAGFPLYVGGTMPGYWKLNTFTGYTKQHPDVFPEPGLPALAYELGYLLGVPIDYYASINICGFPRLVDEVGGVEVCNSKPIQDSGYHWTDGHVGFTLDIGRHHLDGETALAYARSRHGSSDFARARRQQELLGALRTALLKPQNLARLPEIVSTAGDLVHTNFPAENIDQLIALADRLQDDKPGQYVFQPDLWARHPPRTETNGRSVQFLKVDAIAALSIQVFGDASLYTTGGQVPSAEPTVLPSATPVPSPTENPC
jgi:LCP family protein required for cell wall assembly